MSEEQIKEMKDKLLEVQKQITKLKSHKSRIEDERDEWKDKYNCILEIVREVCDEEQIYRIYELARLGYD